MTTYNTGNPIGSVDVKDLYDNAQNLDIAVNNVENETWTDRLGVERKTFYGMEQDFQQFLIDSGYVSIGDYAAGLEITARNQVFWRDGELYRAGSALALPYTTTGDWGDEEGLFVAVGDQSLRQDLANPDKGAAMVARASVTVTSLSQLSALPTNKELAANLDLGGRSGTFLWRSANLTAEVASDPLQGLYVAPVSDPSGAGGAWVRQFGQALLSDYSYFVGWFGADESNIDNSPAIQAAYDFATATRTGRVTLGKNTLEMQTQVLLDKGSCTFVGSDGAYRQSGSVTHGTYLLWTGGASPMFNQTTTGMRFKGFSVGNAGSATDWLELNSGAQNNEYDDLYFFTPTGNTPFSRSVIRSNGNRLGYSEFSKIRATSPAPVFLDIDGQGTGNSITPIAFKNRCMFFAASADFTVLKIKDEAIEGVSFTDSTLVGQSAAQLTVVDTTSSPLSPSINTLRIESCELESNSRDPAHRLLRLTDVANFEFSNNDVTGSGAVGQFIGELARTNLTGCSGNRYRRVNGGLFNADAESTFSTGKNVRDKYNTGPLVVGGSGIVTIPYGPGSLMIIDGSLVGQNRHAVFVAEVTNNSAYQFRVGLALPYSTLSGQVFTVVVKNTSGDTIAAPTFTNYFKTAGGFTAPAPGFSRSVTFFFDGYNAIEIGRSEVDVPN